MSIRVSSASTGVIHNDCPYQSYEVFETGRRLSWPQAYFLYAFHACRNSSRTRVAVAGIRCSVEAGATFAAFCAVVDTGLINTRRIRHADLEAGGKSASI